LQSCLRILSYVLALPGAERHASVRQHHLWCIIGSYSNIKAAQGEEADEEGLHWYNLRLSRDRHLEDRKAGS
jgi:hypothetical protein